jgi:hypothetical protein
MDRNEIPVETHNPGVALGVSKMISEPMVRLSQNRAPILHRHKHCLQPDQNEILEDPCHLGVLSGASKMISESRWDSKYSK